MPKAQNEDRLTQSKAEKARQQLLQAFSFASGLGLSLVLPLTFGVVLGKWIDNKIGTEPKFTLSLLFFGLIIGLSSMYRAVAKLK